MRFDRLVLIILLLVLPVAFWPGSTSYDAAKFTLLALACACWLGGLAWRLGRGRPVPRPPYPLLLAAVSLLAVLSASAVQTHHVGLVVRTVCLTILWLAVLFQTAVTTDSLNRMHRILAAAVIAGVAACLYGLAQMAGLVPGAPPSSGYPPGISTLGNQNYLSGMAAVLIWPSFILWSQGSTWRKAAAVTGTVVLVSTVLFAGAAGPWFGVVGSGLLIGPSLILARRGNMARVPLVLLSSLVAAGILGGFLLSEAMRPPPATKTEPVAIHRRIFLDNHGSTRRTNWLVAGEMFRSSPLTGRGAGNYQALWPVYRASLHHDPETEGLEEFQPQAVQAHNEYFQFLGETGLTGGVWMFLVVGSALVFWKRRWQGFSDIPTRTRFLLLTAGLFTAGLHAMVSFPIHLPATALMLALIPGLMASPVFAGRPVAPQAWKGKRILAVLPAILALFLAAGSIEEFVGDSHTAAGKKSYSSGRMVPAVSRLEKGHFRQKWPGDNHLYLGLAKMASGAPEEAYSFLKMSIAEKPTFEGYLALAELSIDQGRFGEAGQLLTIVEGCEPLPHLRNQAAYLRGLAEMRMGKHEQAYGRFRRLLENDPENQRAWLALGYLAVLAGDQGKAQEFYSRAMQIIDRKIMTLEREAGNPQPGELVRLGRHRNTAQKAIDSLNRQHPAKASQ